MKNFLILIIIFYILALIQSSFLIHFLNFQWAGFILTLIAILFINFFEKGEENLGIFAGFWGGFFLDIFSEFFFGFWILILVAISLFLKFILKKYVQIPFIKKT